MALETEDDYQDKIDDLNKEIEKLYDEGTDKGFKLKREEEMDQEQRAMETQDDYQKAYDKQDALMKKINDEQTKKELALTDKWEALEKQISEVKQQLKVLEKDNDAEYDKEWKKLKDIWDEAKKKGFKLKGSFRSASRNFESRKNSIIADLTDLETRKNEVLQGLEARALKTEKDYQRDINDWADQVEDRLEKVKFAEEDAKYWRDEAQKDYKSMLDVYNEGTKKGFKLKVKKFKI